MQSEHEEGGEFAHFLMTLTTVKHILTNAGERGCWGKSTVKSMVEGFAPLGRGFQRSKQVEYGEQIILEK